jgi:hypothetical protein
MKKVMLVALVLVVMLLGIVAYASAHGDTIEVTAHVRPKLVLSLPTVHDVYIGEVDPDDLVGISVAGPTVTVSSNTSYDFSAASSGAGFSDTYAHETRGAGFGSTHTGNVSFLPSWSMEGTQTGAVQFTATPVP